MDAPDIKLEDLQQVHGRVQSIRMEVDSVMAQLDGQRASPLRSARTFARDAGYSLETVERHIHQALVRLKRLPKNERPHRGG